MFIAAMGAAQFAMASAVDMLRSLRVSPDNAEAVHLAASDPGNPYGALLPWPRDGNTDLAHGMARTAGASVVIINGELAAFLRRRNPSLRVFLPEAEPERTQFARALARKLAEVAAERQTLKQGLLVGEINGAPAQVHVLARFLEESGFLRTALGFQMRRSTTAAVPASSRPEDGDGPEAGDETSESS
jgi:ATP-dependent helicase Lhr and Lhr-like helicase